MATAALQILVLMTIIQKVPRAMIRTPNKSSRASVIFQVKVSLMRNSQALTTLMKTISKTRHAEQMTASTAQGIATLAIVIRVMTTHVTKNLAMATLMMRMKAKSALA